MQRAQNLVRSQFFVDLRVSTTLFALLESERVYVHRSICRCLCAYPSVYLRVYLCDFLPCHQARVLIATVTLLSCVLVSEAIVGAGECPLIIGVASTEGRPDVFKSYIGGQWRTSSSGKTLKVMSPVNETTLFEVQVAVPVAPAPLSASCPHFAAQELSHAGKTSLHRDSRWRF